MTTPAPPRAMTFPNSSKPWPSPRRLRRGRSTARSSLEDPYKCSRPGTCRHCTGTRRTRPHSRGRGRSRKRCTWRRRKACQSRTLRLDRRRCRPPQRRASSRCCRSLRLRRIRTQVPQGRGYRNEPARPRVLATWKDRTGQGCSCQPMTMEVRRCDRLAGTSRRPHTCQARTPVPNSDSIPNLVTVSAPDASPPVDVMVKARTGRVAAAGAATASQRGAVDIWHKG
jgi:hypothetical protein